MYLQMTQSVDRTASYIKQTTLSLDQSRSMETLDIAQGNNSENSHVTSMAGLFTRQPIVTEVPFSYLADDAALLRYTEFRVALWIDYIYVPICASFGIAGNLLSMRVLLPSRMSESSTCVYMAAMSASDIIIQICNILFLVRKFEGHEVLTTGSCGLIYFLFFFSIHSNVIVMVVMTAERYLAISHPLQAGQWFSKRKAQLAVVVTWMLVLMIDLHHLIIRRMDWNEALQMEVCVPVGATSKYFAEKIWPWLDGALYCYIPFFSVLIFNILIVHQMNVSSKFRESNIRGGRTETADKQSEQSRQITIMLLLVTCTFLLLVGPMAVIIVVEREIAGWMQASNYNQALFHLVRTIINNLSYTNHAINFILYSLSGNRFRREFTLIFCPCCLKDERANKQQEKKEKTTTWTTESPGTCITVVLPDSTSSVYTQ